MVKTPAGLSVRPQGRAEGNVILHVKRGKEIAKASFTLTMHTGDEKLQKSVSIPIRPPYPMESKTQFTTVEAGKSTTKSLNFTYLANTANVTLTVSSMPDVKLLSGLTHLIKYPYGCVEQTTSSVFPQLYLKTLLKQTNPEMDNERQIDRNINGGIERLLDMALPSGRFGQWPGDDDSYDYGTVYASHFLAEAHRAGYPVPDPVLSRMKGNLQHTIENNNNEDIRSYALYVLSILGKHNVPIARKLLKDVDDYHRYYLVASLVRAGKRSDVKKYLYDKTPELGDTSR
ncbi:MAG: hypothetical protein ABEJ65_11995, partial [bacterium]